MKARRMTRDELQAAYDRTNRRLSAYEVYVHLVESGASVISARVNQPESQHGDEWFSAKWYGADRADGGCTLIVQHYGRGNQQNSIVLFWSELESSTDSDYQLIRERLQVTRYRELAA